jgi:signal transduction histidine kinase
MSSIRGFAQLLTKKKVMNNNVLRKKYFDIIIQDINRLEHLISDILDLSRLDLGTMKFNFIVVNISDIIAELENLCSLSAEEHQLKFKIDIAEKLPKIKTDKSRLVQVLTNLVNNAIKYTREGHVKLQAEKSGNNILFTVTDTGPGVPKQEQERIFERFYQIDSSYTRKAGGSGLGLAIAKEITERLGGKISIKSTLGKGSIFYVRIPIRFKEQ